MSEAPWLASARGFVGLKEIAGSRHEAQILKFFADAGHPEVRDDATPWCAAFVNSMLLREGFAGTGSLAARSFLLLGRKLDKPVVGCIAVFKRGKSAWQGHVAFFLRQVGNQVEVLGANQGNAVSIARYPKSSVLGYRWPTIKTASNLLGKPLSDFSAVYRPPLLEPASPAGPAGPAKAVPPPRPRGANPAAFLKAWNDAPNNADPDVFLVQWRLMAMGFNPGGIDGLWGGNTSGAVAGFLNDRPGKASFPAPVSDVEFRKVLPDLNVMLGKAAAEGFKRPINEERSNPTEAKLATVAPEIVPVKQGFFAAKWAAIVAAFWTAVNIASNGIAYVWNFITGYKDNLPEGEVAWTYVGEAWKLASAVPGSVWLILVTLGFGALAFLTFRGQQGIAEAVQKGDRL